MKAVDIRARKGRSGQLSQILFFVEHVNATCREAIYPSPGPQILQLQNVVLNQAKSFYFGGERWRRKSEILALMVDAGIEPPISRPVLEALIERLMSPARLSPTNGSWSLAGSSRLREPVFAAARPRETVYIYRTQYGYDFAALNLSTRSVPAAVFKNVRSRYFDEPLNAIDVVKDFLTSVLNIEKDSTNHYIQRWINWQFGLRYDTTIKYSLADLCRVVNKMFFGSFNHTQREQQSNHAKAISVRYLIEEIISVLPSGGLKAALGIYWLLRFCKNVRPRVHWLDLDENLPHNEQFSALDNTTRHAVTDAILAPTQCVIALRPLQYTYFQTRAFGAISGIRGLNTIFRGGLLPHTDRGRTFLIRGHAGTGKTVLALQLMADMARRGRFALYFSMEESYEALVDRLVTFGFVNENCFSIRQAGEDASAVVKQALEENPRRGLLLLYGNNKNVALVDAIDEIANALGNHWRWRGLAIDSANELDFYSSSPSDTASPELSRTALKSIVDAAERNLFCSLIIAAEAT